jgi:CRISPR/Cas system-associated endonuclease/helicase Cas3
VPLAKRFEEERLLREQRKKDKEEQHLYIWVRAITGQQFRAHQGFDLASWDDKDAHQDSQPIVFRFKKASKIRELVEQLAQGQSCSPEQLRLWVMVNRQNKTVRPDQPLLDLDKSKHSVFAGKISSTVLTTCSCRGNGNEAQYQRLGLPYMGRVHRERQGRRFQQGV